MTVLRIAARRRPGRPARGGRRKRRPPAQARSGVLRAGGRLVLRARPSVGVHGVRRRRLRRALGAAGAASTGSRFSRSLRRRSGSRRSAFGAVAGEPESKRRCRLPSPWVRPATSRPGRLLKASRGRRTCCGRGRTPRARPLFSPERPACLACSPVRENAPPFDPVTAQGQSWRRNAGEGRCFARSPHSGAAKYRRCMCRMQRKSRGSSG